MERLTNGVDYCQLQCDFGKDRCFFQDQSKCYENNMYNKLREYEIAEEQGLLLRLPCKVGDNVYKIWSCGKNGKSVAEFRISHIDIDDLQNIEFAFISTKNISTSYWFCKIGDFGKTVFLTKEEAEQALKQMGE